MIQVLIELIFHRWLTIKRWNNFPRIEDVSILDNAWYIIHIALFLSHIEEKSWKKVNREFLIKRILFWVFSKLVLSDINSWTLNYIKKIDPEIYNKFQDKVHWNLFDLDVPDFIKKDMQDVLNCTSHKLELDIIDAARKYSWLQECIINSKVFPWAYDVPMEELNIDISAKKQKLESFKILMNNENYKTYLSQIRRLCHSKRWPWEQRKYDISVMAHLYIVTFFAYIIWSFEIANWKDYNILEFMMKWIYHDIPEVITWDIITPTKRAIPGFSQMLEKVEWQMMNDFFFVYIDKEYEESVKKYMLDPFTDEIWKYVKHADIFSMIFESRIEVTEDNKKFTNIYNRMLETWEKFNTKSSEYILKHCVENFWKSNFNDLLK